MVCGQKRFSTSHTFKEEKNDNGENVEMRTTVNHMQRANIGPHLWELRIVILELEGGRNVFCVWGKRQYTGDTCLTWPRALGLVPNISIKKIFSWKGYFHKHRKGWSFFTGQKHWLFFQSMASQPSITPIPLLASADKIPLHIKIIRCDPCRMDRRAEWSMD